MKFKVTDKRWLLVAGILVALVLFFLYHAEFLLPRNALSLRINSPDFGMMIPVSEIVLDWAEKWW